MKAISQVIQFYAQDHGGSLPDTIEELAVSDGITPETFVCPSGVDEKADAKSPSELLKQLRSDEGHCSYVYHGRGLKLPLAPDKVILSEPLTNHSRTGMNVLFGDMQVRWLSPAEAEAAIKTGR